MGWFKNKNETEKQMQDLINDIKNTTEALKGKPMSQYQMPSYQDSKDVNPINPAINDVYTVGVNVDNCTIINLKSGMSTMTLTLGPYEVNRMVRLLLATLDSEDRDFEEKQQQEENE